MRTNYKRIQNIIEKHFEVEAIEKSRCRGIVAVFVRNVDHVRIVLVDGHYDSYMEQGIHLRQLRKNDLEHYLVDALNTALKDGFSTIYIHQEQKSKPETQERRRESILGWMKYPWFGAMTSTLDVSVEETLETMDDKQLALVLKLISAAYQSAGDAGRKHWAPKYHNLRKALVAKGIDSAIIHRIADASESDIEVIVEQLKAGAQ